MNYIKLIYLSVFCGVISILSFFNIVYSYYLNLYLNLNTYLYTFILSFFLTIIFYVLKKDNVKKSTIYQKILTIFLGYFFLPLLISIPFYFSIYNLTFVNSYFEAISGFTSTGFTVFDNINHIDQSLILWRCSSQWVGGLYFLFSIIVLIDIFDHSFKKSLTNFISFNNAEIFKQSLKIFLLYSIITLGIFIVLNISGIRLFNSLNLAMTIISSGGFLPSNNLSNILINNYQIIVTSVLMLTSFFSIFLIYNLFFAKNYNVNFFNEDIHLFFYYLTLIIIFFTFFNFDNNFIQLFLSLSSSVSNIGFSLSDNSTSLSFVFLLLVMIGGSFFSTSSGIRFLKIYSLFKYSINEILSYSRPKNVYINKHLFSKEFFKPDEIFKYFLSVIILILTLLFLIFLLTLSDINFENSFKISILTLMNTVNSSMYGLADFSFYDLHSFAKYCLIFFMIVGRLELLTLLIICKKFLFKN
ncbi:trk system potassium uptake protein TrkH [Candidatus Pelagibacter ubique]|uniref:Trk system potassium uptake protein TrkH n=1 Tax=Pelagibacter ubique TaxID=198252 RepID=A0ABX1T1T9_PELUQ|nr:trk system potassium uptake protein TrkH [Candidatus Pelagibacter ubique]